MNKKKPTKPVNPNKPLKNPKHEIMARKLAQGSSQVKAYKEAYPDASPQTCEGNASRLIASTGINDRALKLLESVGLNERKLALSLNECVESETESIKLDATKHGLKLIGYGQEDKDKGQASYNPVQIVIQMMQPTTPQPLTE